MRLLLLVSAILTACTVPEPRANDPVATHRQATGGPVFTGTAAGARLGASVAFCPPVSGLAWVAGQPGVPGVVDSTFAQINNPTPTPNAVGLAVACTSRIFSGGTDGLFIADAGWEPFGASTVPVVGLALETDLLVVRLFSVEVLDSTGAQLTTTSTLPGTASAGALLPSATAMADAFVVGLSGNREGRAFAYAAGLNASLRRIWPRPDIAQFGRAVVAGKFAPGHPRSFAIAGEGLVVVYDANDPSLVPLYTVDAGATAGPLSLAALPNYRLSIDALVVGAPETNEVAIFFGDVREEVLVPFSPGADEAFGTSVAATSNKVLIGAPDAGPAAQGAVYLATVTSPLLPNAVAHFCVDNADCFSTFGCQGRCRGHVLCVQDTSLTCMDAGAMDAGVMDAGVMDAGVMDAGVVDAGVVDAGVVDAGVVDAGVVDAGVMDAGAMDAGAMDAGMNDQGMHDAGVEGGPPVVFTPVGCSEVPAAACLSWLLVVNTLVRRRRT